MKFTCKSTKGISTRHTKFQLWSNIRELRSTVGKLTENYVEKLILSHSDLDLWPKVTNINCVWVNGVRNRLAKTASKSVHPFGWSFVYKQRAWHTHTHTHRHTDRHIHTQTNCSENVTPQRFRRGVIRMPDIFFFVGKNKQIHKHFTVIFIFIFNSGSASRRSGLRP